MIESNRRLFRRLYDFCNNRGAPTVPPDGHRYIEGDVESDRIIQHLRISRIVQFGPQRAAVHATLQNDDLIILVGFDYLDEYVNKYPEFGEDVVETDCLPGHVVVALSEVELRPIKSGLETQAYLEVADSTTDGYEGHDVHELRRLFPRISVFKCRFALDEGSFQQIVLKFAVAESTYGGGWIDDNLLDELYALVSISAKSFPYEAVSRASFDTDPRSLYLALYRCLEATYAYKKSSELAKALGLSLDWSELAVKLEQTLNWRPREASSLESVLRHASEADLKRVVEAIGDTGTKDLASSAASSIYKLRNRIVHFDASLDSFDLSSYDWNAICCGLVGVVWDVFHQAFDPGLN